MKMVITKLQIFSHHINFIFFSVFSLVLDKLEKSSFPVQPVLLGDKVFLLALFLTHQCPLSVCQQ